MTIRKEGKVFEDVAKLLRDRGIDPKGLAIAGMGRGPDKLVLINGEIIGCYNFVSRELVLYSDLGITDA